MKKLLIGLSVLAILLLPVQPAFAHVLITDETNTKGAILHLIPDDDPIAGQQATIFFDTQTQLGEAADNVSLNIRNTDGTNTNVDVKKDGTLTTANYIFPIQGVYELTFTVTTDGKTYIFKQSQRVSRGVATSTLNRQEYTWAEILLLTSGIGFALLGIVVFNRRKDIAEQSKW